MTEVFGISNPELEAIRSVERYIATSIPRGEPFSPDRPVQDDLATVNRMLSRLTTAPPVEEVATRPNGNPTAGSPIGIVRDHPSHDEGGILQAPSVVAQTSREMGRRWAKEAIGLAAVELNEAYAQFVTTRDGCVVPDRELHDAARRLNEAMQRLGLTDEIPF